VNEAIKEGSVEHPREEREWLTIKEVQEILAIGRTKAWQLVASGEIPAIRIGRSVRISRRDLDAWLRQQRYGSST
jgi:excisionase family DNA binding protein